MKKGKLIIVFIALLLILGLCYFNSKLMLELKGDSEVNLNINSEYFEPGYNAIFNGEDITDSVQVSSNVDTSKLGNYIIKYSVRCLLFYTSKERKVNIIDN